MTSSTSAVGIERARERLRDDERAVAEEIADLEAQLDQVSADAFRDKRKLGKLETLEQQLAAAHIKQSRLERSRRGLQTQEAAAQRQVKETERLEWERRYHAAGAALDDALAGVETTLAVLLPHVDAALAADNQLHIAGGQLGWQVAGRAAERISRRLGYALSSPPRSLRLDVLLDPQFARPLTDNGPAEPARPIIVPPVAAAPVVPTPRQEPRPPTSALSGLYSRGERADRSVSVEDFLANPQLALDEPR